MRALKDALRSLPEPAFADVLESPEAYLVVIDLPGAGADGVDVSVTDRRVSIEARRAAEPPEGFAYVDRSRASILDVELPLPPDAAADAAEGSLDRGVLELRVPKRGTEDQTDVPIEAA